MSDDLIKNLYMILRTTDYYARLLEQNNLINNNVRNHIKNAMNCLDVEIEDE